AGDGGVRRSAAMSRHIRFTAPSHLFLVPALCLALASVATAADTETVVQEGVLILHSNQRPLPAGIIIDDTLRRVASAELGRRVEFYSEFLDAERFPSADY